MDPRNVGEIENMLTELEKPETTWGLHENFPENPDLTE